MGCALQSRVFLHSEAHGPPEKECAIYLSPGTLDFSLEQQVLNLTAMVQSRAGL